MKQIKAFIHRNRVADVVGALKGRGYNHLSIVDVKGLLEALDIIREKARTGQNNAGWVYVFDLKQAYPIE